RNRVIFESCILAVDLHPLRLRQHQIQPRLASPEHRIEWHPEDEFLCPVAAPAHRVKDWKHRYPRSGERTLAWPTLVIRDQSRIQLFGLSPKWNGE
ncbi:hypothetical protein, partial [Pseudomonas juntendi]|uniref:hypothetical protein n=1 Tax=Pseudomonas juntendi TaxID=2666183 RepID=UPI001C3FE49D